MTSAAPIPQSQGDRWFYRQGGREVGPITSAQLKELANRGALDQEALVRHGSAAGWTKADQVKGLFLADGWFAKIADQAYGPMTSQELVTLAKQQRLGPNDYVRRSDQKNWTAANQVAGLFALPSVTTNTSAKAGSGFHVTSTQLANHAGTAPKHRPRATPRGKHATTLWLRLSLGAIAIGGLVWGGVAYFARPSQPVTEPAVVALKPPTVKGQNSAQSASSTMNATFNTTAPSTVPKKVATADAAKSQDSKTNVPMPSSVPAGEEPTTEPNKLLAFLRNREPEVTGGFSLAEFYKAQPDSKNGKLTHNDDGSQYLAWGGGLLSGEALFFRGKLILYRRSGLAPNPEVIRTETELFLKNLGPPSSTTPPPDGRKVVSWKQWDIDRFVYSIAVVTIRTNRGVFDYYEHTILTKDADQ